MDGHLPLVAPLAPPPPSSASAVTGPSQGEGGGGTVKTTLGVMQP